MKKSSRKDKIYQKIMHTGLPATLLRNSTQIFSFSFHAAQIEAELNIDRANVSRALNQLVNEGQVLKISGKPVLYFAKEPLEAAFHITFTQHIFPSKDAFLNFLHHKTVSQVPSPTASPPNKSAATTKNDAAKKIFNTIIGADSSLKNQIKQAIAAIIYPPNGLHTFLIGPTGVGKTTFAELMHCYAIEIKRLRSDAPYIIFNCTDYAGNAPLLLSYLFGHLKGAFTGADKEKKGLIDAADGGILFLDEVHRLPPEGQEMLFSLIDRGKFRRLGESDSLHTANVLLILATTENPEKSILTTFLRRIPCVIKLPGLAERPLTERMQLISAFFMEESKKIKLPVIVAIEVLKLLLLYDCKGNIGQLKNDIQITCASAFVEYISGNQSRIYIKLSLMADRFKEGMFTLDQKREELLQNFDLQMVGELTFDAQTSPTESPLGKILLHDNYRTEEDFYENILTTSRKYFDEGKSIEDIKKNINLEVESYFNKHAYRQIRQNDPGDKSILFKFVQEKIINVVEDILADVAHDLAITIDAKIVYGLALHIETLLERLKNGIYHDQPDTKLAEGTLTEEYRISQKIKEKLEKAFQVSIPKEEATFIAMFLYALKSNPSKESIAVLVLAHGDATASSMASVANQLLATKQVQAIDMPLTETVNSTLTKVLRIAQEIPHRKGILLLVDMGSLTAFADVITKKTGMPAKTVKMVSTPMVIEAARKSIMPGMTLERLASEVESASRYIGQHIELSDMAQAIAPAGLPPDETDWFCQDRDRMMKLLEKVLTFLNPPKAYDLLNQVYHALLARLHITPDRGLKIKFIFHNMSMIERAIAHETLDNTRLKELKKTEKKIFLLIKKEFALIENTFGTKIPDSELAYIVEMLRIYRP